MQINPATLDSRLRRLATRNGYMLRKSRAALSVDNHGGYMIVDPYNNTIVAGEHFDMYDEDVIKFFQD